MRVWIRLLLIVLAMLAAVGCIIGGGRPRTGTNIGTGSDNGGPWSQGESTPAHTGSP